MSGVWVLHMLSDWLSGTLFWHYLETASDPNLTFEVNHKFQVVIYTSDWLAIIESPWLSHKWLKELRETHWPVYYIIKDMVEDVNE